MDVGRGEISARILGYVVEEFLEEFEKICMHVLRILTIAYMK